MIPRLIADLIWRRLKSSPAVGIVGPRQCGKTTLAQSLGGMYYDMEQETERLRLDLDWDQLVINDDLIILDEAQTWPSVFPMIRGAVDQDRKRTGRFLLLGSVSPSLMTQVSESLAGRLALVELSPMLQTELSKQTDREKLWLLGGYPDGGILAQDQYPHWQRDYLALLTQRDLPAWGLSAKPQTMDRLLRMLAAVHGQVWNASKIAQSLGVNYKTVNTYLDYLIGAFLIRLVPPYFANIRKRLVKSPKLYWRDSGLLHALLNVPDKKSLIEQPWVGASWEGFCIEQTIGTLTAKGVRFQPYYFRTNDRYEIDLVLDFGNQVCAIEFKLTTSPTPADMEKLMKAADMIGATRRFLVSKTKTTVDAGERVSCGLAEMLEALPS